MAKKPSQEPRLKVLIRNYVSKMGELAEEIKHPELEFGFLFFYPKGLTKQPDGKIIYHGRPFQANKSKKEDFIVISHKITLSPDHVKFLESTEELKHKVYDTILDYFLVKDIGYQINRKEHFYIISERIYPDKNNYISKDKFFKSILRILHSDFYSVRYIQKECSGKINDEDIDTGFSTPYHI